MNQDMKLLYIDTGRGLKREELHKVTQEQTCLDTHDIKQKLLGTEWGSRQMFQEKEWEQGI